MKKHIAATALLLIWIIPRINAASISSSTPGTYTHNFSTGELSAHMAGQTFECESASDSIQYDLTITTALSSGRYTGLTCNGPMIQSSICSILSCNITALWSFTNPNLVAATATITGTFYSSLSAEPMTIRSIVTIPAASICTADYEPVVQLPTVPVLTVPGSAPLVTSSAGDGTLTISPDNSDTSGGRLLSTAGSNADHMNYSVLPPSGVASWDTSYRRWSYPLGTALVVTPSSAPQSVGQYSGIITLTLNCQ